LTNFDCGSKQTIKSHKSGIKTVFILYKNEVDSILIYVNSNIESELIAEKNFECDFKVFKPQLFKKLLLIANE
jgi:hypothetical protein